MPKHSSPAAPGTLHSLAAIQPIAADRMDWEFDVMHALCELGDMSGSDASGMLDLQSGVLHDQFDAGTTPEAAAAAVLDAGRSTRLDDETLAPV